MCIPSTPRVPTPPPRTGLHRSFNYCKMSGHLLATRTIILHCAAQAAEPRVHPATRLLCSIRLSTPLRCRSGRTQKAIHAEKCCAARPHSPRNLRRPPILVKSPLSAARLCSLLSPTFISFGYSSLFWSRLELEPRWKIVVYCCFTCYGY